MKPVALLLLAALPIQFEISDAKGKKPSGIAVEAGAPDADGWMPLQFAKSKGDPVIIWPFDRQAKAPEGPGAVPVIVIQSHDPDALKNLRTAAALATPFLLGSGPDVPGLPVPKLVASADPFEKGVGLLYSGKPAEAAEALTLALKDRQRQLTRIPSEIYAMAMLLGTALHREGKFDDAAVAFLTAQKQRPSDAAARAARAEALVRAGKPEAAEKP